MLLLANVARTRDEAREQLVRSVTSGAALEKFRAMIGAQGGEVGVVENPSRLPRARLNEDLLAPRAGYVQEVDALGVALAALRLGAGRAKAEDKVDPAVGIDALVKIGEPVEAGARLCRIHANDETALAEAKVMLAKAIVIGEKLVAAPTLVGEVLG